MILPAGRSSAGTRAPSSALAGRTNCTGGAPRVRADRCPVGMPHRARPAGMARVRYKVRARDARDGSTRAAVQRCRSCSSRRRSRTAGRRPTAPWQSATTSASPRRRRRARQPPRQPRPRRRRAPPARGAASALRGSTGSSPAGTGLGGVVRTCRTTASARARHSMQSSQMLEVLVQRSALDLADLAVRGHGDPQPRHLAQGRERVLGLGCGRHGRVESRARSTSNTGWVPLPTSMDETGVEKFARSSGIAPRPAAAEALVETPECGAARVVRQQRGCPDALRDGACEPLPSASASGMKMAAGSP